MSLPLIFFFQAEDGIRDVAVTGVQTCALPISIALSSATTSSRRTTLTVLSPSDFAIGISARPTPELALFWITQDPDGRVTKSVSIRYAVGGLMPSIAS